jgi:Fe-S-cluster-containing dehydrogenase component/CRP-like cAMP-binding protein
MPREITHHGAVIDAIEHSGILSELVEQHEGHFKYELDLEVMVYGRTYADKRVGPYTRLWVYGPGEEIIQEGDWGRNTFFILLDGQLDVCIQDTKGRSWKTGAIELQNIFGEMAVLAGQPSTATIVVPKGTEATVLEIQRPAFRLLRKFKKVGDRLEQNYRHHGLNRTLLEIQQATNYAFSSGLLEQLKKAARFVVYPKNHLLLREGELIDRLIFINNGWIQRVSGLTSSPHQTRSGTSTVFPDLVLKIDEEVGLDFIGAGNWLGLDAIAVAADAKWSYSATIMGRTEALEISIADLRANSMLTQLILEEFPHFSDVDDNPPEPPSDRRAVLALSKEISTGIVDATNLLVMDMDLCVRCGNCSMACHKVHGHSRLLRHGIHIARPLKPTRSIQHVLLPNVCLHCQDPECLTGCPTGAISRLAQGHIDIEPKTCIGCGDCATQCPYNAISMVPRKPVFSQQSGIAAQVRKTLSLGIPIGPQAVTETSDLVAVKCNLCDNTSLNPKGAKTAAYSCEENCPTGALVRVNPREYFSEAKNTIGIVFKDRTHAIGRNIHKRDVPARVVHAFGVFAIIAITTTVLWAVRRHNLDGHLEGTWLTMRWITGILGLGSIAGVITYTIRKQVYTRRVGPLRYWKLVHAYLGITAGIVLLIHGGRDSGGLLTSMLMVSLDVAIVSGLFGVTCYFIVPRIMTSIEGDPLLIEDLRVRREELRETLALIDTSDDQLRDLIKTKMRKRFFSLGYLLRQYLRREDLTKMLSEARDEFRTDADTLADPNARKSLMEAVETTATLRRVDALIYLHQLLKLWLAPHVVSVSIMLALLCAHVVQVVLFTVR